MRIATEVLNRGADLTAVPQTRHGLRAYALAYGAQGWRVAGQTEA